MVREINYLNGKDYCFAGYDVFQYVDDETGESAALIAHLRTGRQIFVDLTDAEDVDNACVPYANGAGIPSESDDGATKLWRKLDAAFNAQSEGDDDDDDQDSPE